MFYGYGADDPAVQDQAQILYNYLKSGSPEAQAQAQGTLVGLPADTKNAVCAAMASLATADADKTMGPKVAQICANAGASTTATTTTTTAMYLLGGVAVIGALIFFAGKKKR